MYQEEHLPAGTIIDGKYELEHPIGVGGMGAVYFAIQTGLGRQVAIKLLHPYFRSNPDVIERFHREARLAASIGHDNICEVTDFGAHSDGSPYLVMPVLKGASLADILRDEKLDINRTCDIMRQVLSALDAAHIAGVVHRDLKPDNIFISQMGDRKDFVKLLDFGISKVMESGLGTELTRTGTVMGTPVYMAPEQARGEKNVDHRLDIYAAGVIMYEALTGKRPHDGDSYNEIVFKIIAEPYPPPRSLNPLIPKKLEKVVAKAMAKDPSDRFCGAKEMSDAIAEVASQPAISSNSIPTVVQQPAKGDRKLLAPILAVLVLLIVGGVIAMVLMKKAPEKTPTYVNITNRAALPKNNDLKNTKEKNSVPSLKLNDVINEKNSLSSTPSTQSFSKAEKGENPENIPNVAIAALKEDAPDLLDDESSGKKVAVSKHSHSSSSGDSSKSSKNKPEKDLVDSKDEKDSPGEKPQPTPSASPSNATGQPATPVQPPQQKPPVLNTPPAQPPVLPVPKNYTNMNQLKAALSRGEITQEEYKKGQANIQAKRAAELERLQSEYHAGKIDKATYNLRSNQIKYKYETGSISGPKPSTPSKKAAVEPPRVVNFVNMKQLKTALRAGQISREQYASHQAKIRQLRAIEYERLKQEYKADKITKAQYKQRISAVRQKYEGN